MRVPDFATTAVLSVMIAASSSLASSIPPQSQRRHPPARSELNLQLSRDTQAVFRSVAANMRPYLVRIETVGGSQPPNRAIETDDGEEGEGRQRPPSPFQDLPGSDFQIADGPTTGVIYSSDGFVVSSSVNFVREPLLISVSLADGRRMTADLVARDQVRKVALLKADATDLSPPIWRDSRDIEVGQWAIALGLGFGGSDPSVTVGIVSALSRMNGNAMQTDAKLSPANYGGPLCDIHGHVLGLSVPMGQRPGELAGVELYDSGVGFAIPKNRLDQIVSVLKTGRSLYRGWLGISVDRTAPGVVIQNVADPSPMREAGVVPGDRILAVNDRPVVHFGHLVKALYMFPAGEQVDLHMQREAEEFTVTVKLARDIELGPLPELEDPSDPWSSPLLPEDEDE